MTRIVAGSARGRRLAVPPHGVRPTTDRVREAMFGALDARLGAWAGRRVLDLYAGSGALGLEALSRGAAYVLLVERDRRTLPVLRANLAAVGIHGAQVLARDVVDLLADPDGRQQRGYDVVLADPPYEMPGRAVGALLVALDEGGWLAPGAVVVLERPRHAPAATGAGGRAGADDPARFAWPGTFTPEPERRYGDTVLHFGSYDGPALPAGR
jgi:16S rRNA (guanine966-N2)-methyltransferase